MMAFWKLLNYEIRRLAVPLAILIALLASMQLFAVNIGANQYVDRVERVLEADINSTLESYLDKQGPLTFYQAMNDSPPFILSTVISIGFLLCYTVFIWYRDSIGRQPFLNRLLMVPAARHHIYFAKLITLLLAIFGMLAVQLILLPIEVRYYDMIVPSEMRVDVPLDLMLSTNPIFSTIVPLSISELLFNYGTGIASVLVLYTWIMLERSYRMRGIVMGAAFAAAALFAALVPFMLTKDNWYTDELITMHVGIIVVISAVSLWLSLYLLKRKISV